MINSIQYCIEIPSKVNGIQMRLYHLFNLIPITLCAYFVMIQHNLHYLCYITAFIYYLINDQDTNKTTNIVYNIFTYKRIQDQQ